MFGGLAFLHDGRMVVGIIDGTLMARVGPDRHADALAACACAADGLHRPADEGLCLCRSGRHRRGQPSSPAWLTACLGFVERLAGEAGRWQRRRAGNSAQMRRRAGGSLRSRGFVAAARRRPIDYRNHHGRSTSLLPNTS
jgi:hypothetical protein